jgi:hypothetical protein
MLKNEIRMRLPLPFTSSFDTIGSKQENIFGEAPVMGRSP